MRIIIREMGIYRIQNILLRKENPISHAIYFCKKKCYLQGIGKTWQKLRDIVSSEDEY
jgi:hypothetical protein